MKSRLERIIEKLPNQEVELSAQKVELGLVQDLIKDAGIAEGKLKSLQNVAARREKDFKKIENMADEIGVKLNSETIKAGKFFRDLENKLK